MSSSLPTVLITGASSGIGAVYADRFAKRGHDLVLVARNRERMEALCERLRAEHGVRIDVIGADLTQPAALGEVAARVHDDTRIGVLINNAGVATAGTFAEQDTQALDNLLELNIAAPTRLAHAAAQRFAREGGGAIVNIASVVGLAPELGMTVYGASKAYVLYLSQGLHLELGPRGVYVQAVLPAATRTEIWERSGFDISKVEGVMEVGELVDAALVGYDRRETVTIPPLPDAAQWSAFDAARQAMLPNFRQSHAAERYRSGQ